MADGILVGGEGVFLAAEQLNAGDFGPQPQFTWAATTNDTEEPPTVVTVTPVADTPGKAVVAVPAGTKATEVTLTVSATDPDGQAVTATLTVPIVPRTYTVKLTQLNPLPEAATLPAV